MRCVPGRWNTIRTVLRCLDHPHHLHPAAAGGNVRRCRIPQCVNERFPERRDDSVNRLLAQRVAAQVVLSRLADRTQERLSSASFFRKCNGGADKPRRDFGDDPPKNDS